MDPITLASTVFVILSPFITEVGKEIADKVGDTAFNQAKHLYQAIRSHFAKAMDGGSANRALDNFTAEPNKEYGDNFQNKLLPLLQSDPNFVKELEQIVKSGPPLSPSQAIHARDNAQVLRNRMINTTGIGKQDIFAEGGSVVTDNLMSMSQREPEDERDV